jgi:hypothetical protein
MGTFLRKHHMLISLGLVSIALILVVVSIVALLNGALFDYPQPTRIFLQVNQFAPDGAIARENQQRGTTQWQLDVGANTTFIQGYAGMVSALAGQQVPLYISSQQPIGYQLDVYRIGWYGGAGGRLMFWVRDLHSLAQGTWNNYDGLIGCTTCTLDPTTRLRQLHWKLSYTLTVGANWLTGVYLIKMTAANHAEGFIPLVIRDDTTPTAVLANVPVNTYQAYNLWGGYSLYGMDDLHGDVIGDSRAYAVTFERPYDRSGGAADFLSWDIHTVRWLEREDMDVSYTTDVDLAEHPEALLYHRVFVDMGHDEYWAKSMRDGVVAARDQGVSMAFLGANDAFWQVRYGPDAEGNPDRILISYKVNSSPKDKDPVDAPKNDPYYPTHLDEVTAAWRDPLIKHPESEILGLSYHSIFAHNYYPSWDVLDGKLNSLAEGTGLKPGMHIPGGLLGYEYDGPPESTDHPPHLEYIAYTSVRDRYGYEDDAATAWYRAPSGALVFDAGSIWWCWGLDESTEVGAWQPPVLHGSTPISRLTEKLFHSMLSASPKAPLAPGQTPTPMPTATPHSHQSAHSHHHTSAVSIHLPQDAQRDVLAERLYPFRVIIGLDWRDMSHHYRTIEILPLFSLDNTVPKDYTVVCND